MIDKPNYYSIIPADVRYDNDLTPNAKLLYAEITSLTNKSGTCWASDQYFMKLYEVQRRTIQNWLKQLEDNGYIKREVMYKNNSKEIKKRFITLVNINAQGYGINMHKGMEDICTDNTTSTNTTSTNKDLCVIDKFNEFWDKYDKKLNRKGAERSFKNHVKDEETFNLIMKDLDRRQYQESWTKDNGKFRPHPTTYLNGHRWLDEYEIVERKEEYKYEGEIRI